MMVSTPFAASTSSAVRCATSDSACVSLPMNSGPVMSFAGAVFADGLRDGEDVGLGERAVQRSAAMPAGAEADQLIGIGGVRLAIEIIALEFADIDQNFRRRGLACQRADGHGPLLFQGCARRLMGGK